MEKARRLVISKIGNLNLSFTAHRSPNAPAEAVYSRECGEDLIMHHDEFDSICAIETKSQAGIESLFALLSENHTQICTTNKSIRRHLNRMRDLHAMTTGEKDNKKRIEKGIEVATQLKHVMHIIQIEKATIPDSQHNIKEEYDLVYAEGLTLLNEVFVKSCGINPGQITINGKKYP